MADILKMVKVITQALFRKTACEMYPKKPAPFYKNSRGHIQIDAPRCILCTICDKRCPTGAIKVDRPGKTWAIDRYKCIYCNVCVEVCPKKCLSMENQYSPPVDKKSIESVDIPAPPQKPPAKKIAPQATKETTVPPAEKKEEESK